MNAEDARLLITGEVARAVLDHALATAPEECCGVLLGPRIGEATLAMQARNVHEQPRTRYQVDPEALLHAVEKAEAEGLEVVGFYHSHPRGWARFSEEDRARGSWEGVDYLLLSLAPLTYVAGRWDGEAFQELEVHLPDGFEPS
ncbi:MAG: M67 family metallopeptidase [Candidatus Thermoplasmatota archaeon]|nr:M67 family metallopeptidase [Candidatus Thermoplasmatota archaeon]